MLLLRASLRDRRNALIGWTVGWLVLVSVYALTWPTVQSHAAEYDRILRDLPEALRAAMGSAETGTFSTPQGYLAAELLSFTGPLLAATMGVLLGAKVTAEPEADGTLELLLAQAVSRRRVTLVRLTASVVELAVVFAVAATGLWLVGFTVSLDVGLEACLRATGMLLLLSVEALCLSALAGAAWGQPVRAKAVAGTVAIGAFLLNTVGASLPGVEPAVPLSPFHTLVGSQPFDGTPSIGSVTTLLLPSLLLATGSLLLLERRDLRLR